MAFYKRNLALFKLAIMTNLEYRFNYAIDALLQPTLGVIIEVLLWKAIFSVAGTTLIAGFNQDSYLAYSLWGPFFARIATSWMYETRMIEEVASGSINSLIVRPISFYEYYLSQLLGYKFITTFVSLMVPLAATVYYDLPLKFDRLPLAFVLIFYYVFLVHSLSFIISCCAFFFNRIHSFTVAKNILIFLLTGELIPLDMMPELMRKIFVALPFSSGVFIPVGYIIGRIEIDTVARGFLSVTVGLVIFNLIAYYIWKKGLAAYVGTGA